MPDILSVIDTGISAGWPEITSKQDAYLAAHGRYFQGLCTHSSPPVDGQPTPPDQLADHPDYQAESWIDVGYDDMLPRAALTIDQYDGPAGMGYVCTFSVIVSSDLWIKEVAVGPESRSSDWHILPELGPHD